MGRHDADISHGHHQDQKQLLVAAAAWSGRHAEVLARPARGVSTPGRTLVRNFPVNDVHDVDFRAAEHDGAPLTTPRPDLYEDPNV
jgi:hypothetical protein